jgi:hypothetical protein
MLPMDCIPVFLSGVLASFVLGHDLGAEMPQGASAVVGGDGVPLTDVRRCLRWYEEHALSCSMELVSFARSRN